MMTPIVTVSIACADAAEADHLATRLVEGRLAACVQTHAIRSTYVWNDGFETAAEVLLTAKTLQAKLPELERAVKAAHSYQVPEIIAQPVIWVSEDYRAWLTSVLMS